MVLLAVTVACQKIYTMYKHGMELHECCDCSFGPSSTALFRGPCVAGWNRLVTEIGLRLTIETH
eukprot:619917-Amphidinium_carterae.2